MHPSAVAGTIVYALNNLGRSPPPAFVCLSVLGSVVCRYPTLFPSPTALAPILIPSSEQRLAPPAHRNKTQNPCARTDPINKLRHARNHEHSLPSDAGTFHNTHGWGRPPNLFPSTYVSRPREESPKAKMKKKLETRTVTTSGSSD